MSAGSDSVAGVHPFDPARITDALSPLDVDVLQPLVRKAAEDFYACVVDTIRDYLLDNLDFNLKSHVGMLERENQRMRTELYAVDLALSGRWDMPETRLAEIERLKADNAKLREAAAKARSTT